MKERVNWTIGREAINVLKAAKKENPKRSLSDLVSYAILQTYRDPLEEATVKAKHHAAELYRWNEIIEKIKEERKC